MKAYNFKNKEVFSIIKLNFRGGQCNLMLFYWIYCYVLQIQCILGLVGHMAFKEK